MVSFFVIELILIVTSICVANKMVKNRVWFTKRFIIGKESESEVEKLKCIAENLLSKEVMDFDLNGLTTINFEIKDGKIIETKVESSKTKVLSSKEDGTRTFNLAWSEKGAVALTTFTIWGIGLWLHVLIGMAYEIYVLSHMLPPQ